MKLAELKKKYRSLPSSSGIYKFFDADKNVIYVGKAKNLKKRVNSYFQKSKNHSPWTKKMIENIDSIETVQTNSELESLILETNYIKKLRPKYNILMKDDKNYVYIKISTEEDYPRIEIVRKRLKDKSKYFGPKTSGHHVKETLKLINKIFMFRTCALDIKNQKNGVSVKGTGKKIPCLDYHIKRCSAPCINAISKDEYQDSIKKVIGFLEGKHENIIEDLKKKMMDYANKMEFRKAAKTRDLIQKIENTIAKHITSETDFKDRDVIYYVTEKNQAFFHLIKIVSGKIIGNENFVLSYNEDNDVLSSFLQEYYTIASDIPQEILLQEDTKNNTILENWLKKISNHSVKILIPQKGIKNHLIELCKKNAENFKKQNIASFEKEKKPERSGKKGIIELQKFLKLKDIPKRIECFDISHLSGTETVGSMAVFENGNPKTSDYRRFKIRTLKKGEIDDYKSMKEVLERRLIKLKNQLAPEGITFRKPKKSELKPLEKILKKERLDIKGLQTKEFIIALKNKKIIASGRVKIHEDKTYELALIQVDKKDRCQKIGSLLITELMKKYKGKTLYTSSSPKNKDFYLNHGFLEINLKKNIPEVIIKKIKKHRKKNKEKLSDEIFLKMKVPKFSSFDTPPDLIIIDGGKGQLSATLNVKEKLELDLQIIALAKQNEEIFLPNKSKPILLPHNSEAFYLVQRIRDEAHRFAISYNQNLRAKKAVRSVLDEISGIGPKMKKKLIKTFGSVEEIRKAGIHELEKHIGSKLAEKIKESI